MFVPTTYKFVLNTFQLNTNKLIYIYIYIICLLGLLLNKDYLIKLIFHVPLKKLQQPCYKIVQH